jgi:ATP-dependent protease ClpP protease subunit
MTITQPLQKIPPVAYATFSDDINQDSVNRILFNLAGASQRGIQELHLFFQSNGGIVSDGVSLYNYFSIVPFELHLYNPSAVDSAAMIAFVGAKHRYASAHAGFVVHTARYSFPAIAEAVGHRAIATTLDFDDNRAQAIIRTHTQIPATKWTTWDIVISAQEALQFGLIHAIREFQPPSGATLFHI